MSEKIGLFMSLIVGCRENINQGDLSVEKSVDSKSDEEGKLFKFFKDLKILYQTNPKKYESLLKRYDDIRVLKFPLNILSTFLYSNKYLFHPKMLLENLSDEEWIELLKLSHFSELKQNNIEGNCLSLIKENDNLLDFSLHLDYFSLCIWTVNFLMKKPRDSGLRHIAEEWLDSQKTTRPEVYQSISRISFIYHQINFDIELLLYGEEEGCSIPSFDNKEMIFSCKYAEDKLIKIRALIKHLFANIYDSASLRLVAPSKQTKIKFDYFIMYKFFYDKNNAILYISNGVSVYKGFQIIKQSVIGKLLEQDKITRYFNGVEIEIHNKSDCFNMDNEEDMRVFVKTKISEVLVSLLNKFDNINVSILEFCVIKNGLDQLLIDMLKTSLGTNVKTQLYYVDKPTENTIEANSKTFIIGFDVLGQDVIESGDAVVDFLRTLHSLLKKRGYALFTGLKPSRIFKDDFKLWGFKVHNIHLPGTQCYFYLLQKCR